MKTYDTQLVNKSGVFPDCLAINSTGAATPDGSEYIAEIINNANYGPMQALMAWAAGGTNTSLSGTPGVPDGVIEAAGASQILEAIQKGNGIGPGMYVQRAIEDSPAAYGDRVIQLSGQGVLVATYPDLNTACWIGGNDAAQVAAKAAGGKFWRADDAVGTTPLAAGPYLMLPDMNPTYLKQYSEANGDFTVTVATWTTGIAVAIPYQTSDGVWRLRGNISGAFTSATTIIPVISGVTFKNNGAFMAVACSGNSGSNNAHDATVFPNTGGIRFQTNVAQTALSFSFDVELDAKPTWADDFSYDWYITY